MADDKGMDEGMNKGMDKERVDAGRYRKMFEEAESHSDYWIDGPISEFTEDLCPVDEGAERQPRRAGPEDGDLPGLHHEDAGR